MQRITQGIKRAGEILFVSLTLLTYLKGLWDLWKGDHEVLTVIFIVVGFFSGLAIVLYVMLKKDTSHVQDAEQVYVYSKRVRHVAKVVGVVLTVLFVWGAVQWQNRVSIRPTAKGKVGIWVARLTGDDTNFSAQRGIVQELEYFLGKEVDLHGLVEIRELPNGIQGKTVPEKNENLVALQGRYGASIIVWGEIAGFKLPELYPMVTVAKWPGIKEATLRLKPITEMDRQMEQRAYVVSQPPGTVRLPPERIREPLKLARFVAGVIFYGQRKWTRAAEYLEKFVSAEVPSAVEVPDVYFYIGLANQRAYLDGTGNIDAMSVAENYFHKALKTYKEQNNWVGYSSVQNDLALAYKDLAERGVDPEQNLQRALRALEEAAHHWKEQQNWESYAAVQNNLGLTYKQLAERGVDPEQNLQRAVLVLEEAGNLAKGRKNWAEYARVQNSLGLTYWVMSQMGLEVKHNLEHSLNALKKAGKLWREQENWAGYGEVQNNISLPYRSLAERGVDPEQHFERALRALKEAGRISKGQKHWGLYGSVHLNFGLTYQSLAEQGFERPRNLRLARASYQEAIGIFQQIGHHDYEQLARNRLAHVLGILGRGRE